MQQTMTNKWLDGLSPDDQTHDAAVRALQGRLGAVQDYLALAAEKAEDDIEHVHRLRVWTRRTTAALRLYKEMLPRRRSQWLKKQLRRVRRAANDARDCDVLIQRLKQKTGCGTKRWLTATIEERAEAQGALTAVRDRLERDHRFARRIDTLLSRVAAPGETQDEQAPRFGEWARERLRDEVEKFFAAVPGDPTDTAALHEFRIRVKRLRYVIELVGSAFPDALRNELYPVMETLQDRLGDINDLATAQARLRKKVKRAGKSAEAGDWRRLLAAEHEQFDQCRQRFWDWCTPEKLDWLRSGFQAVLSLPRRGEDSQNGPSPKLAANPSPTASLEAPLNAPMARP